MPSPILARADALMHRKRPNEAGFDDVPILTDAIGDDDDIPVLLEVAPAAQDAVAPPLEPHEEQPEDPIETPHPEADMAPEIAVAASDDKAVPVAPLPGATIASDAALREQLASELARRVEQRLAAELPRIIESTLREFLAEQEMIAASSPRD
ncbi:hypothetical protein LZ012_15275 [Dechloromonas sp. XY25]|uniref:DUF2497 domain-containing protein n=1 Tax=Dechloromonas hankyongensis TaxID=2908002 RepID=A0ABS9K5A8_9RHOO|nr:hypothetical protein [Dechloromonas hankyongensis]MCG2578354.1 hypothetical protein [Dechloromonas hankyongensis]